MSIHDSAYTNSPPELAELREFLISSYTGRRAPLNWRPAMFENWYYASRYLEAEDYFASRAHLWRADGGQLVAFLIRYYDMTYPQILPAYRSVEDAMWDWAERTWAGDTAQISTLAYEHDPERLALLLQRGYQDQGLVEYVRIYELARPYPEPVLPPRFRIATMAQHGCAADRVALENSIWGATLTEAWFRGKSSAPSYSFNWDLLAISPDGQLAAACLVWIDWRNRTAEVDPLGTHPAYRGQGLARALVTESLRRLRAVGIESLYIASAADNAIVNRLYGSLQPVETFRGHRWTKRLSISSLFHPGETAKEDWMTAEELPWRIRQALQNVPDMDERAMFGGIGFLVRGNMACGSHKGRLIVRVGPEGYEAALARPHGRPFDITGRPMKGWVLVRPEGYASEQDLRAWVQQGVDFALTLPPK